MPFLSNAYAAARAASPVEPFPLRTHPRRRLARACLQGDTNLARLLQLTSPTVYVPLLNTELNESGALTPLMSERGEVEALQQSLAERGVTGVDVDFPAPPGESLAIAL